MIPLKSNTKFNPLASAADPTALLDRFVFFPESLKWQKEGVYVRGFYTNTFPEGGLILRKRPPASGLRLKSAAHMANRRAYRFHEAGSRVSQEVISESSKALCVFRRLVLSPGMGFGCSALPSASGELSGK